MRATRFRKRKRPWPGTIAVEGLGAHREAVRLQLVGEPARGADRTRAPGRPERVVERQVVGDRRRGIAVEGRRQAGRLERGGPGDAEGEDEQRQPDEQPGAPVEAAVDRALERPTARTAPLRRRRVGSHGGSSVGRPADAQACLRAVSTGNRPGTAGGTRLQWRRCASSSSPWSARCSAPLRRSASAVRPALSAARPPSSCARPLLARRTASRPRPM